MKIQKIEKSNISNIDFDNLTFGGVFTDHMFVCSFKKGEWTNPEIKPYQPISISPSARVFHYGQACFEGMKAYKDQNDKIWLFRPKDNHDRIVKSSKRLAMPVIPEEIFMEGLTKLIGLDKDWVKPGVGNSLYIRPFIFADQASIIATETSSADKGA